jgi:hypothetical protein
MDLFCHSILSVSFAGKLCFVIAAGKKGGWGILAQCWGSLFYASATLFSAVLYDLLFTGRFDNGNCYEISWLGSVICPLCNVLRRIMWHDVAHIHPHGAGSPALPCTRLTHGRGEGHAAPLRSLYTHIYTDQVLRLLTTKATVNILRASVCICAPLPYLFKIFYNLYIFYLTG